MAKFRYEILSPGRKCVGVNADGTKRYMDFTPEYCINQANVNHRLLKAGFQIPVCIAHDPNAKILAGHDAIADRTKSTVGLLERIVRKGAVVLGEVDVPDAADQKTAKIVKFCSPRIAPFVDSNGKDWGPVFQHIAITPKPVQHKQRPIQELSHDIIQLSLDPVSGIDLADEEPEKPEKTPPEPEKPEENKEGEGTLEELIAALRRCKITIPPQVDDLKGLTIAVEAYCGKDDEDEDAPEEEDSGTGELPSNVEESGERPIAMSLEHREKQMANITKKTVGIVRTGFKGRIGQLFADGRITKPIKDKLEGEADKIPINLDLEGEVKPNALTLKLEAYEELPKGRTGFDLSGDRIDLASLGLEEENMPSRLKGKIDDKEALTAWDRTPAH